MHTPADDLVRLQSLTPDELRDVIDDLALEAAGTKIYICVDPHELYDFCFPIDPLQPREVDIDLVADDQIALHETFYGLRTKPILLPEYRAELESLTNYLNFIMHQALRGSEVLREFVMAASLPENAKMGARIDEADTELVNVYLALGLGVRALGVERFVEVTASRIQMAPSDPDIAALWERYTPTRLVDELNGVLLQSIESKARQRNMKKASVEREIRSARCDAAAADRIVFLNSHPEGLKVPPFLFLYFSSAPRTSAIFEHELIRNSLPIINGEPKRLWRTRTQIFAYVVSKGFAERQRGWDVALRAQNFLREFEHTRAAAFCEICPMRGGTGGNCSRLDNCRSLASLADEIRRRRSEIVNLGLIGGLRNYRQIIDGEIPQDELLKSIVELLRRLAKEESPASVRSRIEAATQVVTIQSEFAVALQRGLSQWEAGAGANFLRTGRDPVAAAAQYLPNRPIIRAHEYQQILRMIIEFYETPAVGDREKSRNFEAACREFVKLDARMMPLHAEHELVRCLLYLGFPDHESDRIALTHAQRMLRRFDKNPDVDREFRYVAGWAARRAKKYWVANRILGVAMARYPEDGRFPHGRSLNTYSWLIDRDAGRACPYTIKRAISDGERAVELYAAAAEPSLNLLQGSCYNNLAYFYAVGSDTIPPDSDKARERLDTLKEFIPSQQWIPKYPEYFETEARVEYAEAAAAKAAHNMSKYAAKLGWALTAIEAAMVLKPTDPDYPALRATIQAAISQLASSA
ncbi:MAG TPA: hypothetical protein VGQ76_25980 [Thermoanaerobaculia bacterium]|jgi:hypothetical protein|nr:hypothetical protein [Thermoanaerobaculia bacterium]